MKRIMWECRILHLSENRMETVHIGASCEQTLYDTLYVRFPGATLIMKRSLYDYDED